MADAKRDNNRVTTMIATSSVDGTTPVNISANPSTRRLLVDVSNLSSATNIGVGRKSVTTAGTAVQLASTTTCLSLLITANLSNTGIICVGDSTVVAAAGTRTGIPLDVGDSVSMDITDLAIVYIDSTVNGDGVSYLYLY